MLRFSVFGGLNAALSSVCGKIGFDDSFLLQHVLPEAPSPVLLYSAKAALIGLLLVLNALLFRFLALGMNEVRKKGR